MLAVGIIVTESIWKFFNCSNFVRNAARIYFCEWRNVSIVLSIVLALFHRKFQTN